MCVLIPSLLFFFFHLHRCRLLPLRPGLLEGMTQKKKKKKRNCCLFLLLACPTYANSIHPVCLQTPSITAIHLAVYMRRLARLKWKEVGQRVTLSMVYIGTPAGIKENLDLVPQLTPVKSDASATLLCRDNPSTSQMWHINMLIIRRDYCAVVPRASRKKSVAGRLESITCGMQTEVNPEMWNVNAFGKRTDKSRGSRNSSRLNPFSVPQMSAASM